MAIAALLGALFLALNLIAIDRTPPVTVDEVRLNGASRELARNGQFRSPELSARPGFEGTYFWQPPGQALVTAACYRLFGFGLWQTRVPGAIFGACVVVMTYLVAIRLLGSVPGALIAALLLGLDPRMAYDARIGRMDTQCIFLALVGVWLYLLFRDRAKAWPLAAISAGISVGLAGLTHPVALGWTIGLAGLILFREPAHRFRALGLFAGSCLLPLLPWLAVALRTPQDFAAQFLHHGKSVLAEGTLLARLGHGFACYAQINRSSLLVPALYAAGLAYVALGSGLPRSSRLTLLTLIAVTFLFNSLVVGGSTNLHLLHTNVPLAICAGALLARLLRRSPQNRGRLRVGLTAALLTAAGVNAFAAGTGGRLLIAAYQWKDRDYSRLASEVSRVIPPGSMVAGIAEVWYATAQARADLRVYAKPDSKIYDYVVMRVRDGPPPAAGFRRVAEVGKPLSHAPLLGRFRPVFTEYWMAIWQSTVRHPDTTAEESVTP